MIECEFYRYNPWDDREMILPCSPERPLPADCFVPENGIPQKDPDAYFDYRFDLMLEAESGLRQFLGVLVGFRQGKKLIHFLLGCFDLLEIVCEKPTEKLLEARFRMYFSDGLSISYSTRMCGCILWLDGKRESFHSISPKAIDDLRQLIGKLWPVLRKLPIWKVVTETDRAITLRHEIFYFPYGDRQEKCDNPGNIYS